MCGVLNLSRVRNEGGLVRVRLPVSPMCHPHLSPVLEKPGRADPLEVPPPTRTGWSAGASGYACVQTRVLLVCVCNNWTMRYWRERSYSAFQIPQLESHVHSHLHLLRQYDSRSHLAPPRSQSVIRPLSAKCCASAMIVTEPSVRML